MKTLSSLLAGLALAAAWFPAGIDAQTPPAAKKPPTPTCSAVRVFPRADAASRMVGGEIQGSNESATGGFATLFKITTTPPEGQWTKVPLQNSKPYRFLRCFGPAGSYATVAEIEFLAGDTKIAGKPYGTFGSRDNSGNDFSKAFDGDTATFFEAAAPQ